MIETFTRATHAVSEFISLMSMLMIGVIMAGVGLRLIVAGRPEAAIPVVIAVLCFLRVPSRVKTLYQDVTGDY